MKELIPMDEYGVFADTHDTPRVDSRFVAEFFEKEHKNVVRDIEKLLQPESGLSGEFNALNFERISYVASRGRRQKAPPGVVQGKTGGRPMTGLGFRIGRIWMKG